MADARHLELMAGTEADEVEASSALSLPPTTDEDWQRAAEHVNGLFVAVVYVSDGKVRRRCFVTLAAAQRHADRARERGQECSVVLAELRPAYVLPGVVV